MEVFNTEDIKKTLDEVTQEKQLQSFEKWRTIFSTVNLSELSLNKDAIVKTFTKQDLKKYLQDITSEKNQKNLRNISRYLYQSSSHYRTLINYYSTLYNFDYVVEGYGINPEEIKDVTKYQKAYVKAVDNIEKINIKKESLKIRFNAYLDGVFYGFARPTNDSFFIQQLSPDLCRISFINYKTGQLGYEFNFAYFNGKERILDTYPEFFKETYIRLTNNKNKKSSMWEKIDSPFAICIKPDPTLYPIPPFVSVFEGILDISDFKALDKGKEEIGNYQLLTHQIPIKTDGEANEFLITEDFVKMFHDNIVASLPEQVAVVTTPMKIDAIKFERDSVDRNKVAQATSQYWKDAGVPEILFGGSTNSTALKYSVATDEAATSSLVEEIESWLNEYIKLTIKGSFKFCVRILKTTIFNTKDYLDNRLKAAQFGIPVKNEIIAILGMKPSKAYLNSFLENEILKLKDTWVPLSSSHTTSGINDGVGAPEKSDEELSDSGLKTRINGGNES